MVVNTRFLGFLLKKVNVCVALRRCWEGELCIFFVGGNKFQIKFKI